MPLPLLFIGLAAATGSVGVGKTVKAGLDSSAASNMNKNANQLVEDATAQLNKQREACGRALRVLGEEKLYVLNNSVKQFLDAFTRIKNVDFTDSTGLEELKKLHVDERAFTELKFMVNYAVSIAGGAAAGTAGGALVAFGAYSAAKTFALASTGTAIKSLAGIAAKNATLAFFGGGSLATGGIGMAGGAFVLGSFVAGPALMVMGFVVGDAARKNLEKARTNLAEAERIAGELNTAALQCEVIRRRTYMFYNLLARLDARFMPLLYRMEDILQNEGDDYRQYSPESKKTVAACAGIAVTIKYVLDTPLLTDDGLLTPESEQTVIAVQEQMDQST